MQDIILDRFQTKIADLGLSIDEIDAEGLIHIQLGENTLKISLDNVRKSYEQDGHFDHLDNLIQSIHNYLIEFQFPTGTNARIKSFSLYIQAISILEIFSMKKLRMTFTNTMSFMTMNNTLG